MAESTNTRSSLKKKADLLSLVAVEPFRGSLSNVASGVGCAGGNEQLFAYLETIFSPIHLEFLFAFDEHHEFIGIVDKVVPAPPRRVHPKGARKSASGPTLPNFCFVHDCHKNPLFRIILLPGSIPR